jgi:hypothetical protein
MAMAAVALTVSGAAQAQAIEEKNLISGKAKLDPAQGYILVSTPDRYQGSFVRVPDAEDWAAYRADWEKELVKAKKKFPGKMKEWQTAADIAVQSGKKVPPKPKEPDEKTFSIGPIESRLFVGFGPTYVFRKDKAGSVYRYLTGVKPGTYIWYGPVTLLVAGSFCYCMGTVKFEVKPGTITDLGDFLLTVARRDGLTGQDQIDAAPDIFATQMDGKGEAGPDVARYPAVPSTLSALPVVRAEFHAAGKTNNISNLMINRVRPIPGILGYDRDTVVDLRTGAKLTIQIADFDPDADYADEAEAKGDK